KNLFFGPSLWPACFPAIAYVHLVLFVSCQIGSLSTNVLFHLLGLPARSWSDVRMALRSDNSYDFVVFVVRTPRPALFTRIRATSRDFYLHVDCPAPEICENPECRCLILSHLRSHLLLSLAQLVFSLLIPDLHTCCTAQALNSCIR